MKASATKSNLAVALRQAATSTFEELAFLCAAPAGPDAHEDTIAKAKTCASVSFSGAGYGKLILIIDSDMLPMLAANMLGEDETSIVVSEQHDAFGELTNIICGNVLPEVVGARAVFNLDAPQVTELTDQGVDEENQAMPTACTRIAFDEGQAEVMLFLDETSLNKRNIQSDSPAYCR